MATELMRREGVPVEVAGGWTPEGLGEAIERETLMRQQVIAYHRSVMREGHHFYSLQEGQKPALSKEGALNLISLFRAKVLLSEPHETFGPGDHYLVRYRADIVHQKSGEVLTCGDGLCTTRESKYAYRWVYESEIPSDVPKATLITRERQRKSGGTYRQYKLPNPDLPDLWNTCMKMAIKRALVDATLKLPLVSELFTQDLEEGLQEEVQQPRQARDQRGAQPNAPEGAVRRAQQPGEHARAPGTSGAPPSPPERSGGDSFPVAAEKLALSEIQDLRQRLNAAFGDIDAANARIREVMGIPAGQAFNERRLRLQMTRAQLQQLQDEVDAKLTEAVADAECREDMAEKASGRPQDAREMAEAPIPLESEASSQDAASTPGYATREQLTDLRALAVQVGEDAYADTQDVIEHHGGRLAWDVYETIKARLEGRKVGRA